MKTKVFTLTFVLFSIFADAQTKPFVLGNIEELPSTILNEKRILNIYLPEGYDPKDTVKYPVIYLLDGSADEDFIHISGLVQFCNFSWVNSLPKSIVVGIANVDRRRDYTYPTKNEKDKKNNPTSGGSAKFIQFIQDELLPFIDKKYKTNSSRMLIGQSLGGLLATEIFLKKPLLFNRYLIVSPSLWWDDESLISPQPEFGNYPGIEIYIAVGGKEEDVMQKDAKTFYEILQKRGFKVYFQNFPERSHADVLHDAAYQGFEYFNKK